MSGRTCDPVQRRRLEMLGYVGFSDSELAGFGIWTRLTPALSSISVFIGTIIGSELIIWTFAALIFAGALLPYHSFDLLYNGVIRHICGTPRIPRHGYPRRFSGIMASSWLTLTGLAFFAGDATTGILLGMTFVTTSSVPALSGFCIPAWIYRFIRKGALR